ncbi:hypothetical protein RFH07_00890 [Acinetobacter seifertii]|uniref:hypothetical protein n=1 Tax=Acinetobacter seifertii TaxID=1530123 RepID=UPI00280C594D|nr:hypothetical protein [Acinetobacter seifertii]MDQ9035186.1 hypothetical protein [Acinetobacter seifertii]
MKSIEKGKVQKIVDKIQSGNFDENDIDNIFMKLRAYSVNFNVFREIADFVAHNDERDRGLVNQALEHMYLRMRFFLEYQSENKKSLDISAPFPSWIIKLINYQIGKVNEEDLKTKFNVTKSRLLSRIENSFKIDKKEETANYKIGKLSINTLEAISYCLGFISGTAKFTQQNLIDELIGVLTKNNLNFDEKSIREESDKITICTLLLFQHSTFFLKGHKVGLCRISAEKESILYNMKFVDIDGNEVEHKENFGALYIQGTITLDRDGQDIHIAHTIMTTTLSAEEWCDDSLFVIESCEHNLTYKKLKLDNDLMLNNKHKLSLINLNA